MLSRVRVSVHDITEGDQLPWDSSSLLGDFYFVPKLPEPYQQALAPAQTTPALPSVDSRTFELAFWQSIQASEDAADFEAYLAQYPKGIYAALARNRLERLELRREPKPDRAPPVVTPAAIEAAMALPRAAWREVQRGLAELGYSPGPADGVPGPQTRSALRAWQRAQGEEATGYLVADQREALVAAAPEVDVAVGVFPDADAIAPGSRYLEPGAVFKDCPGCPEMVVVPAYSFTMGSPRGEEGHDDDEGPEHRVTILKPFAVGRYEVMFDEWEACVEGGGCNGYRPNDQGWGRGRRPVINVSWQDGQAYVSWLRKVTGEPYRLLSEAEWEYVARAGTTTRYSWGDEIARQFANYGGNVNKTTEVGSYPVNPWDLHDVHGNVWEWVEECWNNSYAGAPDDGSAWTRGDCDRRVLRGGSWSVGPGDLRSAGRNWGDSDIRGNVLGFRVARTLR